jgi:hypothetical protein
MSEVTKLKRRIQQLEKCLKDIGAICQEADDDMSGHGCDDENESPHFRTVMRITRRMGKTLPRRLPCRS